jgi:hypothetical protein
VHRLVYTHSLCYMQTLFCTHPLLNPQRLYHLHQLHHSDLLKCPERCIPQQHLLEYDSVTSLTSVAWL